MNINWYPGHMAKTKRQITEDLKLVDVVLEILDARMPISSQNPDIAEIVKEKKRIIVLNKCDLAEEAKNNQWVQYFTHLSLPAILVNSNTGKGIDKVIQKLEDIMVEDKEKSAEKGRIGRSIKALVLGIPNVGKSSFINKVSKKASTQVGNMPGVTKQKQWVRVNDKVQLLDTPGVLWPKFDSETVALHLSFTGTIKDELLEQTEIAFALLKMLLENYLDRVVERYGIQAEQMQLILQKPQPINESYYEIMQWIGRKRGAVISGGRVDDEKTAKLIIEDFRSGKLGRITLENPVKH